MQPAPVGDVVAFTSASRALFGDIEQRFLDGRPGGGSLTSGHLGPCRLIRLRARAHVVRGQPGARIRVDDTKLLVQVSGTSRFEQDGRSLLIEPGTWIAYDPTVPLALVNRSAVHQVILQVPRGLMAGLARPQVFAGTENGLPRLIAAALIATANEMRALDSDEAALMGDNLLRMVAQVLRRPAGEHEADGAPIDLLRQRIKAYIAEHMADPDLSIDGIAAAFRCSKRYLYRAFDDSETTPERYLWGLRLDRCGEMLAAARWRNRSISDLAFACGFNSSAHFARAFKARFGMTPRAWRRSQAASGEIDGVGFAAR